MLRVALVLDRYDPRRGGLEHWAHELVRWLVVRGHEVRIVAFDAVASAIPDGVAVNLVPARPGHLERAAAVARRLDEVEVDVVHDLGVGWRYDVLQPQGGSKLASARQSLRSLPLWRRALRTLDPRYRRRIAEMRKLESRQYAAPSGLVVSVSRLVHSELALRFGVAADRLRIIYNGVDTARFSPGDSPQERALLRRRLAAGERVLFLIATHNYWLKGVHTALRALRMMERRGADSAHLAVIGRGPVAAFERKARQLGVAHRVTFCGPVGDQVPYLRAADVFLHPTFYDACSLAVLEAWACGLPVITSVYNGAAELMTPGIEGMIVRDPASAAELAAAMGAMLDEPSRRAMGANARHLALQHPLEANFTAIEQTYRDAVAARRRDPTCRP